MLLLLLRQSVIGVLGCIPSHKMCRGCRNSRIYRPLYTRLWSPYGKDHEDDDEEEEGEEEFTTTTTNISSALSLTEDEGDEEGNSDNNDSNSSKLKAESPPTLFEFGSKPNASLLSHGHGLFKDLVRHYLLFHLSRRYVSSC